MACTDHQDVVLEVNAVGWAPSGARTALSVHHEQDPARLPAAGVGHGYKPSGRYALSAGRADVEDGLLCQAITPGVLKPRVTYRVAGWISVSAPADEQRGHHPVRVSIRVDDNDGAEPARFVVYSCDDDRLQEDPQ